MIPRSALRFAASVGLLLCVAALCRADLPTDPFRRCATKALRGDFGKLSDWQRAAYRRGLDAGVTADKRLIVTAYLGTEGSGRVDRYGNPCTMRTAASNRLPRKCFVWTERWGMRQVTDCGAKSNDRCRTDDGRLTAFGRAHVTAGWALGTAVWTDLWFPTARAARRAGCDGWTPTRAAVIP